MQLWKDSDMAKERQAELEAATEACKALNIHPEIGSFLTKYAYRGGIPKSERAGTIRFTGAEQAALDRYNKAREDMKTLREDYIIAQIRKDHEEARAKGLKPPLYITHADPQEKQQ